MSLQKYVPLLHILALPVNVKIKRAIILHSTDRLLCVLCACGLNLLSGKIVDRVLRKITDTIIFCWGRIAFFQSRNLFRALFHYLKNDSGNIPLSKSEHKYLKRHKNFLYKLAAQSQSASAKRLLLLKNINNPAFSYLLKIILKAFGPEKSDGTANA